MIKNDLQKTSKKYKKGKKQMRTKKKVFKTMLTFVMAMLMTLAMGMTALAAGPHTLTIKPAADGETHEYTVYKVFSGDTSTITVGGSTKKVLSNIKWANGVDKTALINELKTVTFGVSVGFTDAMCASEDATAAAAEFEKLVSEADKALLASVIAKHTVTSAGTLSGTNAAPATIATLEDGYYFVKETTASLSGSAYSRFMLTLVDESTIDAKSVVPSVEKKINESGSMVDANTAGIGDIVNYVVTSAVPDTTGYNKYFFEFTDTLSAGLSYENDMKIYINGTELTDPAKFKITQTTSVTDTVIKVLIYDMTPYTAGDSVELKYSAEVNSGVDLTINGNPNKVSLKYSNNPSHTYTGDPDTEPGGETPEDKVVTYSTTLEIRKTDETGNKLTGAFFKVEKYNGSSWEEILAETEVNSEGKIVLKGLGEGQYQITETQAPTGYNKITTPITLTIGKVMNSTDTTKLDYWTYTQDTHTNAVTEAEAGANPVVGITTVANKQGITLPSTGGIGTTIFYVVGGILVVAAAILLITRKRMASEE